MQNLLAKHDTYQNMIICVWLPQMKQLSPSIIYINTLKKKNKQKKKKIDQVVNSTTAKFLLYNNSSTEIYYLNYLPWLTEL